MLGQCCPHVQIQPWAEQECVIDARSPQVYTSVFEDRTKRCRKKQKEKNLGLTLRSPISQWLGRSKIQLRELQWKQLEGMLEEGDTPLSLRIYYQWMDRTPNWSYGGDSRLFIDGQYFQGLQVEEQELALDREMDNSNWDNEERRGRCTWDSRGSLSFTPRLPFFSYQDQISK